MTTTGQREYLVPAVVGAAAVLNALSERAGQGATVSEIARATARSKSTCHNLLRTLAALGLVARERDAPRYRLGPALIPLGAAATREARPVAVATELGQSFAVEEGLSLALAQPTPDGRAAQVVAALTPPRGIHVGITVGDRYEIGDGAVGKTLLAALPPGQRLAAAAEAIVTPRTTRTITDPDRLLVEAETAASRGWAVSEREFNENHAVSSHVCGPDGRLLLVAVALGFPSQLPPERIARVGATLAGLCDTVTRRVGGAAPEEGAV